MHQWFAVAFVVLPLFAAAACSKRGANKPSGDTLAMLGERAITTADFKAKLAEQPSFAQGRYRTLEHKKELLDGLIRSELLLQEAHRRGLDQDPEVKATMEKVIIHKLTRVYADEQEKAAPIPESDLRRYYVDHHSEFVTPTRLRLSHLFLAVPEKDPRRARTATEAAKLLQQIKAKESSGTKQAFELTASQRSEDTATKATGGDLGYKLPEELLRAWGAPFADAATALKTPNEIGPIVATPTGIHLIKLLGRQEGYETSFDAAKSRIESRLAVERKSHAIDQLVADLKKKTDVHIDEKALAHIEVGVVQPPSAGGTVAAGRPTGQ